MLEVSDFRLFTGSRPYATVLFALWPGQLFAGERDLSGKASLVRNGYGRSQSSPQFLPEVLVQSERSSWMPQREVRQKGDDIHPFAIWPGVPLRSAPWGCCFVLL
jgi:hypothetical protein